MDPWAEYKSWNHASRRRKHRVPSSRCCTWPCRSNTKSNGDKGKQINWTSKLKTFVHQGPLPKKWKDNLESGRKYLQIFHLLRVERPGCMKNSYDSTANTRFKNSKDVNRHFCKDTQIPKEPSKRCSTSGGNANRNHNETPLHTHGDGYKTIFKRILTRQGHGEIGTFVFCWRECKMVE